MMTTESTTLEQAKPGTDAQQRISASSVIRTIAALVLLGAVAGAIASFLILGVDAILGQLGNPESTRFTQLVASILERMTNVLVVWVRAPIDGAIMGAVTGVAVSIAYVIALWIDRSWGLIAERRWLFVIVLAVAGAIGAAAGSRGVLTDVRFWAALAGALYGLVAAYAIAQSRAESAIGGNSGTSARP